MKNEPERPTHRATAIWSDSIKALWEGSGRSNSWHRYSIIQGRPSPFYRNGSSNRPFEDLDRCAMRYPDDLVRAKKNPPVGPRPEGGRGRPRCSDTVPWKATRGSLDPGNFAYGDIRISPRWLATPLGTIGPFFPRSSPKPAYASLSRRALPAAIRTSAETARVARNGRFGGRVQIRPARTGLV